MEAGTLPAFPTLAAQLFADWLLFGEWPLPLWSLDAVVLEELRFYLRHVKVPRKGEKPDAGDEDNPGLTDADVT